MSGISRITKLVTETAGFGSFDEAERARAVDINIVLAPDKTGKVALMAVTALNLAIRCFTGKIKVHLPARVVMSLVGQDDPLIAILKSESNKADAAERVQFVQGVPSGEFILALGCEVPGAFIADCAGWISYINRLSPEDIREMPAAVPAAVFAVACSIAKLFKTAVLKNNRHSNEKWQLSLQTLSGAATDIDFQNLHDLRLGSIALLGAGAIGSSIAFTLSLSGYKADLLIIDDDWYEEPNFETTMLISKADALNSQQKAPCLAKILNGHNITAAPLIERVDSSSAVLSDARDILICGVDNDETRRDLDGASVNVILNGGIGGRKEDAGHILISGHLIKKDYSLSTLYPAQAIDEAPEGPVPIEFAERCNRVPYLNIAMAAPFLGVAVSALLVARCVQESLGAEGLPRYMKFDMLNLQGRYNKIS